MSWFRLLPWEYAIRNLFRRPLRTALTLAGLTIVVLLVLVVVGFIRGMEKSLNVSGDRQVALVFSLGMGKNLEYSSIPQGTGDLLSASVDGIQRRYDHPCVSPELYLATDIRLAAGHPPAMGLVRGVTPAVLLVRRQVEIDEGDWPGPGEALVGRMAAAKMGASAAEVAVGKTLTLEGKSWRISGLFSAGGAVLESEVWCRLDELQQAMKRQDLSLVAVTLAPGSPLASLDMFCKERLDLELQAIGEPEYFAELQQDYRPVRMLAWFLVLLIGGAGVLAGLNTMHGAIVGRTAELSMLQTVGFSRRAVLIGLVEEGIFLAAAASLIASALAILLVNGMAVRFTMGAFALEVDSTAILIGCITGLVLGILGSLPPALRALRMPIVEALKAV